MAGHGVGKLMYEASVSSHLMYCASYRCMAPKREVRRLHRIQRRAIEVITERKDPELPQPEVLQLPHLLNYNVCNLIHEQIIGQT